VWVLFYMKLIPLSKGKFAQVDDEDYDFLMQWKWRVNSGHSGDYAARTAWAGYKVRKKVTMHRLLMKVEDPSILIDHKDHDTLNNQKNNLRICTLSQNARNRKSTKGSTSKYLGVHKNIRKKSYMTKRGYVTNIKIKWLAKITTSHMPRKEKTLGAWDYTPENEILAAKAYDEAAKIYHGEFANLNFKD